MPRGLRLAAFFVASICLSTATSRALAQAPAYLVRDINALPEVSGSNPSSLVSSGGAVLFSAGTGVYRSDGTALGTALISSVFGLPKLDVGGTVYYAGSDANGTELWKSDGTVGGTQLVADIEPGPQSSSPASFVEIGGTIYFTASDTANGNELWKTDGTGAGTQRVKDIAPGAAAPPRARSRRRTARCSSRPTTARTASSCGRATAPTPAPSA